MVNMFTLSDTLKRGGNAADAAVAMAATLAVTEPCSTGPGGDAFCLFYSGNSGEIRGINGRLELFECADLLSWSRMVCWASTSVSAVVDRLVLRLLTSWKDVATQLRHHLHLFMPWTLQYQVPRHAGVIQFSCLVVRRFDLFLSFFKPTFYLTRFWKITKKTNFQRGIAFKLFTSKKQKKNNDSHFLPPEFSCELTRHSFLVLFP